MPNAGPVLVMQLTTVLTAETKSKPLAISTKENDTTDAKYTNTNANTVRAVRSGMFKSLILTILTALGCNSSVISRNINLTNTSKRIILMPPPVEPALANTFAKKNSHNDEAKGHAPKFSVE